MEGKRENRKKREESQIPTRRTTKRLSDSSKRSSQSPVENKITGTRDYSRNLKNQRNTDQDRRGYTNQQKESGITRNQVENKIAGSNEASVKPMQSLKFKETETSRALQNSKKKEDEALKSHEHVKKPESRQQTKMLKRKPSARSFYQQQLPACQIKLTAASMHKQFFVLGIILIPCGLTCLYFSEMVKEKLIDYTKCQGTTNSSSIVCLNHLKKEKNNSDEICYCRMKFSLETDIKGKVFIYYSLKHFFQNHRKYVRSRDDKQLIGILNKNPTSDCEPFKVSPSGKPILPCGAIANSLFNDSIKLFKDSTELALQKKGRVWEWDKKTKFINPGSGSQKDFKNFDKPTNWKMNLWELDPEDSNNNGLQNEDLIIWMRTSAFSTFRKLYRIVPGGLTKGNYELQIEYNFFINNDKFAKRIIFSNMSVLGAKNPFLGFLFIVVGLLCIILGAFCLYLHVNYGKRPYKGSI